MKKLKLALPVIVLALVMIFPATIHAEYYTTSNYNVDVVVNEDHSYNIVETIDVTFTESRHGIYRYIPTIGTYYREIDGKTVRSTYFAKITDVSVEGYTYDVYDDNGDTVIQIGHEDVTVFGDQTYVISYTYDPGADDIDEFDDFYFNVIPQDWATAIDSASFTITMPKGFDESELYVYAGEYGTSSDEKVDYYVIKNTIYGSASLDENEGITVNLRLEEGYYVGANDNGFVFDLVEYAAIVLLVIGVIFAFRYIRRKKVVEVINFYPPYDFTPAQAGCVYHDGTTLPEDALAVLFYLGDKGYLSIEETKKGDYTFRREKELDDEMPDHIRPIYNGLFKDRDEVTYDDLKDKFHRSIKSCQEKTNDYFNAEERKLMNNQHNRIGTRLMLISFIPDVIFLVACCYMNSGASLVFGIFSIPVVFFVGALFSIRLREFNQHKLSKNIIAFLKYIAILALNLFLMVKYNIVLSKAGNIILFVQMLVCVFVALQMTGLSDYGAEVLGQIRGFKRFIETAEKDTLNALVEENPSYFFDILPYAYVFGITDKWAKNFEGLLFKQPDWYQSYDTREFYDYYYYDRMMRHTMEDMHRVSVTKSHSGGGGGGSFSSDSGGGHSGGGAGGGGGGSW